METTQQNFILGLWGVRYQVKDVQRSIAFYTQMLGFNLDLSELARIRSGFNRQSQTDSQRSRCFWFQAHARWTTARARGLESDRSSSGRFACTHCRP